MTPSGIRVASLLLAVALGTTAPCWGAPSPTDGSVRVGDLAPDFALPTLDGRQVRLADRLGRVPVLVVFWSYFCFPCQKELPEIGGLYRSLGPRQLDVIGICLDGPRYGDRILPFVRDKGITFPNAYDRETQEFFEVAERYGVVGTPTSFLLDSEGRVRFIHLGRLDPQVFKGLLKSVGEHTYCAEITKPHGQQPR